MVSDFRKERYNLVKIFVDIDIAKLNHFTATISSDGEIIIEPFKFKNGADGFQLLVSKLESFDKNSFIIGYSATNLQSSHIQETAYFIFNKLQYYIDIFFPFN